MKLDSFLNASLITIEEIFANVTDGHCSLIVNEIIHIFSPKDKHHCLDMHRYVRYKREIIYRFSQAPWLFILTACRVSENKRFELSAFWCFRLMLN